MKSVNATIISYYLHFYCLTHKIKESKEEL